MRHRNWLQSGAPVTNSGTLEREPTELSEHQHLVTSNFTSWKCQCFLRTHSREGLLWPLLWMPEETLPLRNISNPQKGTERGTGNTWTIKFSMLWAGIWLSKWPYRMRVMPCSPVHKAPQKLVEGIKKWDLLSISNWLKTRLIPKAGLLVHLYKVNHWLCSNFHGISIYTYSCQALK